MLGGEAGADEAAGKGRSQESLTKMQYIFSYIAPIRNSIRKNLGKLQND